MTPGSDGAAAPRRGIDGRVWLAGFLLALAAMAALGAWIWRDLEPRIAVGQDREAKTGQPVGPDRYASPRSAARPGAKPAVPKADAPEAGAPKADAGS